MPRGSLPRLALTCHLERLRRAGDSSRPAISSAAPVSITATAGTGTTPAPHAVVPTAVSESSSDGQIALSLLRRHKLGAGLALAAVLALLAWRYGRFHHPPGLTETDSILLSDFTNTTGTLSSMAR